MRDKNIKVLKRDGSTEEFDSDKIERIAVAAGLTDDEAKELTKKVISQIQDVSKENDGQIGSIKIRGFVFDEMEKINEYAAGLFKWFEKNKEKTMTSSK